MNSQEELYIYIQKIRRRHYGELAESIISSARTPKYNN